MWLTLRRHHVFFAKMNIKRRICLQPESFIGHPRNGIHIASSSCHPIMAGKEHDMPFIPAIIPAGIPRAPWTQCVSSRRRGHA
jgi:hypothetical protein